jgi:hypothetical protein
MHDQGILLIVESVRSNTWSEPDRWEANQRKEKLKRVAYVLTFMMVFAWLRVAFSGVFQVYPGAQLDDIYELKQPETVNKMSRVPKVFIFTTHDFFDSVVSFYRGNAREYRVPGVTGKSMKLSSGQEFREAYFILDDAADIMTSKHWIKIQRPYLGRSQSGKGFQGKYQALREVTAIIVEDKRTYP